MSNAMVYGNGVLAEDGGRAVEFDPDELYELIRAEADALRGRDRYFLDIQKAVLNRQTLGIPQLYSADDLAETGWGIIWPPEPLTPAEEAHREALGALIEHRRRQSGRTRPAQFHYQEGLDYDQFLFRAGRVEPGSMRLDLVPYYLCIVGPPERIPWEFQQHLDGEYAVGRIWFDEPEDCGKYVRHLLEHEAGAARRPGSREVLFVGTRHPDDPPTQQSATEFVGPLHEWLAGADEGRKYNSRASLLLGDRPGQEALKRSLAGRLGQHDAAGSPQAPPSVLFTAGHGLEFGAPSDSQYAEQGALILQDWPGWFTKPRPEHYFSADDVRRGLNLAGTVAFCFACHSAGTPREQDWVRPSFFRRPKRIAPKPFVARLPQKLLAGGMPAFVGHVSRAWESSFLGVQGAGRQLTPFKTFLGELLTGRRVGHATDSLNLRWAHLTVLLEKWVAEGGRTKDEVIALWQARNDFRGYAIIGDPAARLGV